MTCLDGLAQPADVGIEWLALHDRDFARPRQVDLDFFNNGCGAAAHDDHAIGQECGLADAVCHEQHGLTVRLPDARQFDAHFVARDRVQRAKRLVHEEYAGVVDQSTADRHTLAHTAGQLTRKITGKVIYLRHRQQLHRALGVFDARLPQ